MDQAFWEILVQDRLLAQKRSGAASQKINITDGLGLISEQIVNNYQGSTSDVGNLNLIHSFEKIERKIESGKLKIEQQIKLLEQSRSNQPAQNEDKNRSDAEQQKSSSLNSINLSGSILKQIHSFREHLSLQQQNQVNEQQMPQQSMINSIRVDNQDDSAMQQPHSPQQFLDQNFDCNESQLNAIQTHHSESECEQSLPQSGGVFNNNQQQELDPISISGIQFSLPPEISIQLNAEKSLQFESPEIQKFNQNQDSVIAIFPLQQLSHSKDEKRQTAKFVISNSPKDGKESLKFEIIKSKSLSASLGSEDKVKQLPEMDSVRQEKRLNDLVQKPQRQNIDSSKLIVQDEKPINQYIQRLNSISEEFEVRVFVQIYNPHSINQLKTFRLQFNESTKEFLLKSKRIIVNCGCIQIALPFQIRIKTESILELKIGAKMLPFEQHLLHGLNFETQTPWRFIQIICKIPTYYFYFKIKSEAINFIIAVSMLTKKVQTNFKAILNSKSINFLILKQRLLVLAQKNDLGQSVGCLIMKGLLLHKLGKNWDEIASRNLRQIEIKNLLSLTKLIVRFSNKEITEGRLTKSQQRSLCQKLHLNQIQLLQLQSSSSSNNSSKKKLSRSSSLNQTVNLQEELKLKRKKLMQSDATNKKLKMRNQSQRAPQAKSKRSQSLNDNSIKQVIENFIIGLNSEESIPNLKSHSSNKSSSKNFLPEVQEEVKQQIDMKQIALKMFARKLSLRSDMPPKIGKHRLPPPSDEFLKKSGETLKKVAQMLEQVQERSHISSEQKSNWDGFALDSNKQLGLGSSFDFLQSSQSAQSVFHSHGKKLIKQLPQSRFANSPDERLPDSISEESSQQNSIKQSSEHSVNCNRFFDETFIDLMRIQVQRRHILIEALIIENFNRQLRTAGKPQLKRNQNVVVRHKIQIILQDIFESIADSLKSVQWSSNRQSYQTIKKLNQYLAEIKDVKQVCAKLLTHPSIKEEISLLFK